MTHDRSDQASDRAIAERAIVFQVLRDDHSEGWSRAELERVTTTIEPLAISDALAHLDSEGVVVLDGEQVQASACARYLNALELICI